MPATIIKQIPFPPQARRGYQKKLSEDYNLSCSITEVSLISNS